jgi:hypothetical protein
MVKLLGRIAWAIVAAGATGIAFWVGAKPGASFWQSHSWLLYAAGAVLAVNVFLPAVAKAWLEAFPPTAMLRNRQLQKVVNAGFLELWKLTKENTKESGLPEIDIKYLGLHAYRIRRRFCRRAMLERVADLRFRIPSPTGITWVKGKGVIGMCWKHEQFAIGDTKKVYEQAKAISADGWAKADEKITFGLTRRQFERTKDYGVVAAQPMFDWKNARSIVGCVAITAPSGSEAQLDSKSVKELLVDLSDLVWSAWNSRES